MSVGSIATRISERSCIGGLKVERVFLIDGGGKRVKQNLVHCSGNAVLPFMDRMFLTCIGRTLLEVFQMVLLFVC